MAKLSKCKDCDKSISKDEKVTISNKSYCSECANKIKQGQIEYKQLVDTICQYYGLQCCTGLIFKQIKDYKEQLGYSYLGMTYTLWYIKEIERKPFNESKFGIAYIKYYYEKARDYYEQQTKISQSISEKPVENIKRVTIKPNTINKKNNWLFDINSLYEEGK
jgi:hypothetical protein